MQSEFFWGKIEMHSLLWGLSLGVGKGVGFLSTLVGT